MLLNVEKCATPPLAPLRPEGKIYHTLCNIGKFSCNEILPVFERNVLNLKRRIILPLMLRGAGKRGETFLDQSIIYFESSCVI